MDKFRFKQPFGHVQALSPHLCKTRNKQDETHVGCSGIQNKTCVHSNSVMSTPPWMFPPMPTRDKKYIHVSDHAHFDASKILSLRGIYSRSMHVNPLRRELRGGKRNY